jgi:hemerythrin-like domain-containing protein
MPDAIMMLQREHRKIGKVLGLIEQQVKNRHLLAPLNNRLLQTAFEYLSGYPDECHHPKEDVLYRKLGSRFPDLVQSIDHLVEEHETLADLTRNLCQVVGDLHHDPSAMDEGLAGQLRAFVDSYHHHMVMEEEEFFPLALNRLSRNDFAEIDFTLFDKPDPLFNKEAEEKFVRLSDEITRLGLADKASADRREESALLATFLDIATFNERMQRIGEPVSLVYASEKGYELQRKGKVLIHIPECSESRSAWCAYFFLAGRDHDADIS